MWWKRYGTKAKATPVTQAAGVDPVSVRARRNAPNPLNANPKSIARPWTVRGGSPAAKAGKKRNAVPYWCSESASVSR
jgi:hypothetical protein